MTFGGNGICCLSGEVSFSDIRTEYILSQCVVWGRPRLKFQSDHSEVVVHAYSSVSSSAKWANTALSVSTDCFGNQS